MTNPDVRSLEFARVDGHGVLLAGGAAGVFRAIDPAPGVVWTELGANLPNALVFDLDFTERDPAQFENPRNLSRDDFLLAATQGRGAWSVNAADQFLADPSVLRIDGTAGDDVIEIRRSTANASLLEVAFDITEDVLYTVPLSSLQKIEVFGLGGNDTLTIDSTEGPISVPDGILFNGGAGDDDELILLGQGAALTTTTTVGPQTTIAIVDARNAQTQRVTYEDVDPGDVTNSVAAATASERFAVGWQGLINLLTAWENGPGEGLPLLGSSLPRALSGRSTASPPPVPIGPAGPGPVATDPLAGTNLGGFVRLIEGGPNGFSLGEIASFTPQELHDKLEAL